MAAARGPGPPCAAGPPVHPPHPLSAPPPAPPQAHAAGNIVSKFDINLLGANSFQTLFSNLAGSQMK